MHNSHWRASSWLSSFFKQLLDILDGIQRARTARNESQNDAFDISGCDSIHKHPAQQSWYRFKIARIKMQINSKIQLEGSFFESIFYIPPIAGYCIRLSNRERQKSKVSAKYCNEVEAHFYREGCNSPDLPHSILFNTQSCHPKQLLHYLIWPTHHHTYSTYFIGLHFRYLKVQYVYA